MKSCKKVIALSMVLVLTFGSIVFAKAETEQPDYSLIVFGDVNNDNKMNTGDALGILLHCIGDNDVEFIEGNADINQDNKIDTGDATAALLYIVNGIEPISNFGKFVYFTGMPNSYNKWQGKEFRDKFLENPLYFSDLIGKPTPAIEPLMIQIDSYDEYAEFIKSEHCPYQMLMNSSTSKFDDLENSVDAFNEEFFNDHSVLLFLFVTGGFPEYLELTNVLLADGTLELYMSVNEDIMPGGIDVMLLLAMPKAEWESNPIEYYVNWI